MKVLVTGATGLLGSTLVPLLRERGCNVSTTARRGDVTASADLCDPDQAVELVRSQQPQAVVHLAAVTDVDLCEREPDQAYRHNVLACANLAHACAQAGDVRLLSLSTDHLYDGPGLQTEAQVTVRNHYAMSKLAGEYAASRHGRATVLRVNFIGPSLCPGRSSLSDWIVESLRQRKPIQVFDDVWFSPLRMASLAHALAAVMVRPLPGVYNLGARGSLTKAQLAFALARGLGLDAGAMQAAPAATRSGAARRPQGMAMDSSHFERDFGLQLPTVLEEVQALLQEYSR